MPTAAVGAAVAAAKGSDETAFGELAVAAMAAVGLGLDGRGCGQKAAASRSGIGYRDVPCMEQAVEVARLLFRAAHPPSLNALTAAAEAGSIPRRILWALLCDKQLLLRGAPAGVTGPHLAALAAAHHSHRAAVTAFPPPWSSAMTSPPADTLARAVGARRATALAAFYASPKSLLFPIGRYSCIADARRAAAGLALQATGPGWTTTIQEAGAGRSSRLEVVKCDAAYRGRVAAAAAASAEVAAYEALLAAATGRSSGGGCQGADGPGAASREDPPRKPRRE